MRWNAFLVLLLFQISILPKVCSQAAVDLTIEMLQATKNNASIENLYERLSAININSLEQQLSTDDAKITFWVNLYNATVQYYLTKDPSLFDDRGNFFSTKRVNISGHIMSLDDIEHGMIRKSKIKLSLGLMGKLRVSAFEKKLRVKKIDHRIHFALNCGAKSCPPVAIYYVDRLRAQLELSSKKYLSNTSIYDTNTNTAKVTKLFLWFRGDFGSKKDIKKILLNYGIIPSTKGVDIDYLDYDWTLLTGNYTEL
jgi:hypothetical protein